MAPPTETPDDYTELPVADEPPQDQVRGMATPEDLEMADPQEEETA